MAIGISHLLLLQFPTTWRCQATTTNAAAAFA